MAQQWLSVMDAAQALGVRPAVIRRRIIHGEVISRFSEQGRLVLVGEADSAAAPPQVDHGRLRRLVLWSWVSATGLAALAAALLAGQPHESSDADAAAPPTPIQEIADVE